ncbi:MAG TPA: GTP-binding protein, partial [Caldilineaceae bacterium]|nr:GTP-binding protein [Caldilineaceae bacterium]
MPTRLILTGGFLGAGKTTLLLAAARRLAARGQRVAIITNDQGHSLVDTSLATHAAIPVVEVAGGCFCCRFPDLTQALRQLERTVAPEIVLAEPVGSCTDLMATVLRPLMAYHADEYQLAPLTVLFDPTRTLDGYADEVNYLFGKQLAEAETIVVNKADLVEESRCATLIHELSQRYAPVQVMPLSAQSGEGVEQWLEAMLGQTSGFAKTLTLDYDQYAEAEARLGWLNAQGALRCQQRFAVKHWLTHFLRLLDSALSTQNARIAHIKVQATTPTARLKASLTASGGEIGWEGEPSAEETD